MPVSKNTYEVIRTAYRVTIVFLSARFISALQFSSLVGFLTSGLGSNGNTRRGAEIDLIAA